MDFESYYRWESLSIEQQVSIAAYRRSIPATFQQDMYPTHLKSIEDLKFLLRSGHNHMWNTYLEELGGFSNEELVRFNECLKRLHNILNRVFAFEYLNLGIEDLLAQFIVSKTISIVRDFFPKSKFSILEIGPGRGYQPIIAPFYDKTIHYKSLDCTPSLYILQHWISKILYGQEFREMANPGLGANLNQIHGTTDEVNPCINLIINKQQPRILHYPWWLASKAFTSGVDLVICNDALNEMHPESVEFYFKNANKHLSDSGIFFVQSLGSSKFFGGKQTINIIEKSGFKLLKFVQADLFNKANHHERLFKLAKAKFVFAKKESTYWSKRQNIQLLDKALNKAWMPNTPVLNCPSIENILSDLY